MYFRLLIAAAAVALTSTSADALVLKFDEIGTAAELELSDLDNDGVISFSGTVGGASITVNSSLFTDVDGTSELRLNVLSTTTTANALKISASHDGFAQGAGDPSNVVFALNGATLFGTGNTPNASPSLDVDGGVDNANAVHVITQTVANGTINNPLTDEVAGALSTTLTDPFSMTISVTLSDNSNTGFDARITSTPSAVPVPAGILLMGTAIAGFGVMRRRKKRA